MIIEKMYSLKLKYIFTPQNKRNNMHKQIYYIIMHIGISCISDSPYYTKDNNIIQYTYTL